MAAGSWQLAVGSLQFSKMGVYEYVDRGVALRDEEGLFVNVKWVRVNKGTRAEPKVRCRLVAQELAYGQRQDELYANTPALSTVKLTMLHDVEKGAFRKLMALDVKCAFLYGKARRSIYIELPTQDPQFGKKAR